MEAWESLGSPIVQGSVLEWPIPLAGRGGKLWLRLPAVDVPELVSLGIADDSFSPPTRLGFKSLELKTHSQVISFDIPPFIESPFLGVRFSEDVKVLDVYFYLSDMAFLLPTKGPDVPFVQPGDRLAPVDAPYEAWRHHDHGELFTRYDDTTWKGQNVEASQTFSPVVDSTPAIRIQDSNLEPAIQFEATEQQKLVRLVGVQNLQNTPYTCTIKAEGADGEYFNEEVTIPANGIQWIVSNKLREDMDRLSVYVVGSEEGELSLNTYGNFLIEVAPSAG